MQARDGTGSGVEMWFRGQIRSVRALRTFTQALLLVLAAAASLLSATAALSHHPLPAEVAWARAVGIMVLFGALILTFRLAEGRNWRWAIPLPPTTTVGIATAVDLKQSAPSMPLLIFALMPVFAGYVFRAKLAWFYTAVTIGAFNISAWRLPDVEESIHLTIYGSCSMVFITALLLRIQNTLEDVMEQYRDSAVQDDLTGLANRADFEDSMNRLLDEHTRSSSPAMLMLVDVRDFRGINDRCGHPVGDQILADVGAALRTTMGCAAQLWRTGGDEFAVWFPGCNRHGAQWYRNLLTHEVEALGVPGRPQEKVGVNIGYIVIPPYHHAQSREVLAAAGTQLRLAKNQARGRARVL